MTVGLAQRVSFDLTCPVCGYDLEVMALGKTYRTEAGMVVRCSAMNCRCEYALRVHLMPNGAKSTSRLSNAIRRDMDAQGLGPSDPQAVSAGVES